MIAKAEFRFKIKTDPGLQAQTPEGIALGVHILEIC